MGGQAEYIEFNGDWHKDCNKCKKPYGASSLEGLNAFFNRSASTKDGLDYTCRACRRKPSPYRCRNFTEYEKELSRLEAEIKELKEKAWKYDELCK